MKDRSSDALPEDLLAWEVKPFRDEPAKGTAVLIIAVAFVIVAAVFAGPLLGIISLFVLTGSVGSFFVTTKYRLTPETVEVRSAFQRVRRPWSDFRRVHRSAGGVSLSPYAGRHLMEPYRSVMLRYGGFKEEVLSWVRRYGPESGDR